MSTIGGLLFGNSPTPAVSSSSSTSGPPSWYQKFYQALLSQGSQAANNPYVPNPNPQVAPLTADQNTAYSNVASQVGAQTPTLNQATQDATNAAAPVSAAQINNYMSPYTSDVVNTIGDLAQRNLTQNLLPAVNDTFTGAGQFGSARNSQFTQQTIQQANESALNQQAQALESGYGTALNAAQTDQARQLSAAGTLGNLASTSQQVGLQGDAALEAAGQAQQQNTQQSLDVANQNWLTQQQYPETQLSWLSTLFNPSSSGSTSTSSNTSTPSVQQPSALSQVAGALGGLGSLIGSLFKEGGAVRGYANGGKTVKSSSPDQSDIAADTAAVTKVMIANWLKAQKANAAQSQNTQNPGDYLVNDPGDYLTSDPDVGQYNFTLGAGGFADGGKVGTTYTPNQRAAMSGATSNSSPSSQAYWGARAMVAARLMAGGMSYGDAWNASQYADYSDPDQTARSAGVLTLYAKGGAASFAGGGPTSAPGNENSIGSLNGDQSVRDDNAVLGNIQSEGEAAAAKPAEQRTPDDVAAIQRYTAAFGGEPGVVNRRQAPAHQGFARGGKTRSVGSLRGSPEPVTPFADHIIIARRAQAALAKPAARRSATDNHAIMTASMLARQSAPQVPTPAPVTAPPMPQQASLGSLQRAA